MKVRLTQEVMAMRIVKEFKDGDYVNLGFGIPNLCAMFIPPDKEVIFHAEQGVTGYGRLLLDDEGEKADFDFLDAGYRYFEAPPGLCWFDMDLSFDMIRGRHLDWTVMGALEVSEKGDLANWTRGEVGTSYRWKHGFSHRGEKSDCCHGAYHKRWQAEDSQTMSLSADR